MMSVMTRFFSCAGNEYEALSFPVDNGLARKLQE